jgi:hypothetical protein
MDLFGFRLSTCPPSARNASQREAGGSQDARPPPARNASQREAGGSALPICLARPRQAGRPARHCHVCRHCSCPASVAPCPPLPDMLAHKLNAVSGVGRRVAGGPQANAGRAQACPPVPGDGRRARQAGKKGRKRPSGIMNMKDIPRGKQSACGGMK